MDTEAQHVHGHDVAACAALKAAGKRSARAQGAR